MTLFDLLSPLVVGFFGSLHCIGMCGPLVVAYSLHIRPASPYASPDVAVTGLWSKGFMHHLAFHAGRIICYGLLGAAASLCGYIAGFGQLLGSFRSIATFIGGLLMVLLGLTLLKVISVPVFSFSFLQADSSIGRTFFRLSASDRIASKGALGFAAGFLPCMLSWAMIVKAATATTPIDGFLTMALFGLGTVPALFFIGLSASMVTLRMRLTGERLAACSVIVMGIILLIKGAKQIA